jgi:hypothetical protein
MLLSLALASFTAWRGVSLDVARTSLGAGNPARLRVEALACGGLFLLLGIASERARRKAHFADVYLNGGLLLGFGGLLSGIFATIDWPAWLIVLFLAAGATAFLAYRGRRTLPFALAVLAAWLGLQRLIFEGVSALASAVLLLSAASAAAAIVFIVLAHRKMRTS